MSNLEKVDFERRKMVSARVEKVLGDEIICSRCGATYKTYNDACSADLLDQCQGFNRIDEVQMPIEAEVFGFNR